MKVVVGNDEHELHLEMVDVFDEKTGFTAMQRTTGLSLLKILEMVLDGRIKKKGTILHERDIPTEEFLFKEWPSVGINLNLSWHEK